MTKRSIALLLTLFLVLPAVISAGGILFAQKSPFAEFDHAREEALAASLGDYDNSDKSGSEPIISENRYIVKFNDGVPLADIKNLLNGMSYSLLAESECRLFAVALESEEFLETNSDVIEYSEPDQVRSILADVNDPERNDAYEAVDVYNAWNLSRGKSGVIVAVLDTGVDRNHEDLKGANILSGYDAVSRKSGVYEDTVGHGTGVIGIIAATANNNKGIAGVAYGVTVLPVKVAVSDTTIYSSDLIRGIRFAADAGAKIINMSIGGYSSSYAEQAAIDYAVSRGCILIAAAGNGGNSSYADQKSYPASYEGVISVASTNLAGEKSSFSQYNDYVDVAAPGENIIMPFVDVGGNSVYRSDSGTSFSCAIVSGIAALAASYIGSDARFESDEFLSLIIDSCGSSRNDSLGYGVINAENVVSRAGMPIITGVSDGGNYSGSVKVGFNRGNATLDGEPIEDGQTVRTNGKHTLIVRDGASEKKVSFRLNYDPLSYELCELPSYAYFEFERGTALLDGFPYASGEHITKSGMHTFVLTDGDERLEKTVNLRYALPTVYGVEEGKTYNGPIEICVIGDGTAELDGAKIYGKTTVFKNGNHVLKITSGNGGISKELHFAVDRSGIQFVSNDYANGTAAIDEENGFICLYGDSLVGVRIYDIASPETYLHFLPVGRVYGHAFRGAELLLLGDSGVTVIDRSTAKSGEESVKTVFAPEGIGYYAYAESTVFGFGNGLMYNLDEFDELGNYVVYQDLGFDCESALYADGKMFLFAPSEDNVVRILDMTSHTVRSCDLGVSLEDEVIAVGDSYIAVGNKLLDSFNGEKVLEFDSNYAVMIENGMLYSADYIIDIASGRKLGSFPFQISDIAFTETANYLFGTEMKLAVIGSGAEGISAFGAAVPVDEAFSGAHEMNVYHTNAFYDKYSSFLSAAASGNKLFLLLEGRNSLYSFNSDSLSAGESVALRFDPSRVTCSGGYVAVCFKNANALYVARADDLSNGRYISFYAPCSDAAIVNGTVFAASGGMLYRYDLNSYSLESTSVSATEVEANEKRVFVRYGATLTSYDHSFGTVKSTRVSENEVILSGGYIAVGKRVYNSESLASVFSEDADVFAIKGNAAVTSNGIFDISSGKYVGDTAIKYCADALITENNTVVTFGGGSVSFCSYGNGEDIISTPEISGISENGIYTESVKISYTNGMGYLDGKPLSSGSSAKGVGKHEFILALPCGRSISIGFNIAAKLSEIKFIDGNKTISVGETVTLRLKYLPDGANSVPAKFEYDKKGLKISEGGVVTALSVGKYTVKAVVESDGKKIEASCVITVRDDLITFPKDSGLTVDRNNGFLLGADAGTTAEEILELVSDNQKIRLVDKSGKDIEGYIATGNKLVLLDENGKAKDELKVVIRGDTDGDGYLSACDLYELKNILSGAEYESEFKKAADVNGNGILADNDYSVLESILIGQREASVGTPSENHFGKFSVQSVSNIESEHIVDVAVVLTGCKYARGVYGKLNYSEGLELIEFGAGSWSSSYYDYGDSIGFYAYSPDGEPCNTAFKVMLNLRFRVTASAGEVFSFSSDGLAVTFKDGCRTVDFARAEFTVDETVYGDFSISVENAEKFRFDPENHEYTVKIPYNNALADITVVHKDNQAVSVSSCIIPDSGKGEIVISVYDSVGTTDYYYINVIREDALEIESECRLRSLEIEGFKLYPVFNPDFYEYSVKVPYETEIINILAVAKSDMAEIYIGDTHLREEKSRIPIIVYSPDGEALTYTLTVTKLPPPVVSEESDESDPDDKANESKEESLAWIIVFSAIAAVAAAVYYKHSSDNSSDNSSEACEKDASEDETLKNADSDGDTPSEYDNSDDQNE